MDLQKIQRCKQVCSQNETQAEEDAAITFPNLGQMVCGALKALPTEAAQPYFCLGTARGQRETEASSELGLESGQPGCWASSGKERAEIPPTQRPLS